MRCSHCGYAIPPGPRNAGQAWTNHMDAAMVRYCRVYREMCMPVEDAIKLMMERFGRSRLSIYYRLLKLDLITP